MPSNSTISRVTSLLASALLMWMVAPTRVLAETTSVPLSEIAQALENCIRGTQVRLNNYAGPAGPNFFKPNDSWIQLSQCLGQGTITVNIPEVIERRTFPVVGEIGLRLYVNDVILRRIAVSPSATGILVALAIEDRGVEAKAHCLGAACATIPGGVLNINATLAELRINLVPEVLGTDISYGNAQATLSVNLSVDGFAPPYNALASLVIGQFQNAASNVVAGAAANALMQAQVRTAVAAALRPRLNQLGIKNVHSVRVAEGQLVIEHGATAAPAEAGRPVLATMRVAVNIISLMPEVAKVRVECVIAANSFDSQNTIGNGSTDVVPTSGGNLSGAVPVAVLAVPGRSAGDLARANKYQCGMRLIDKNGAMQAPVMAGGAPAPQWTLAKPGTPFTKLIQGTFPPPQ